MRFRVRVSNPLSHVILKKALSPPSLGQWPPILVGCDLSRVDHNHRVTWLIYHVITLYLQKCASPVSQRQWPLNLVGLWVRVKRLHLLFQVPCLSSIKYVMYPLTQGHRNQLDVSKHRKNYKSKAFFVVQKVFRFDSHRYAPV